MSSLLTNLSQSSVQMPRCTEGWVASDWDLREKCHWEEEAHTDSMVNLQDHQPSYGQDSPTGVGVG